MSEHVYRYKGGKDGAGLSGVPRRDLTAADVARLGRQGHLADVEGSPLYETVKREQVPAKQAPAKAEQPAMKEGGEIGHA